METINLKNKFSRFSDYCNPRILGEVNDCHVKAVKLKGEFICIITTRKTSFFLLSKARFA